MIALRRRLRRALLTVRGLLTAAPIMLAASSAAHAASPYPPLRLVTQEWPPYAFSSGRDGIDGDAVAATRCVLDDLGVAYSIDIRPWARAQAETHDGLAQGFFPASRSSARDAFAMLSQPIAAQRWLWMLRVDDPADPFSDAFRRQRSVTAVFGSNMHAWLTQEGYRAAAAPYDVGAALRLVVEGRVDAALGSELVSRRKLAQLGLEPFLRFVPHSERPLGVYFSKAYLAGAPGFLAAFDARAAECRAAVAR